MKYRIVQEGDTFLIERRDSFFFIPFWSGVKIKLSLEEAKAWIAGMERYYIEKKNRKVVWP